MVTKEHAEHLKALHRAVYNDWGLYSFVQMLTYKCLLAGKELVLLDEREMSKTCSRCGHTQPMPLWKRTYRCGTCGLEPDRDEKMPDVILLPSALLRARHKVPRTSAILSDRQATQKLGAPLSYR